MEIELLPRRKKIALLQFFLATGYFDNIVYFKQSIVCLKQSINFCC